MTRRADSQRALLAALQERLGDRATFGATSRRPWASATFTGMRHRLEVRIDETGAGGEAQRLMRSLPEMDFRLPGHLVADIALIERRGADGGMAFTIEALTIEEE